jgi:hypothetical protein
VLNFDHHCFSCGIESHNQGEFVEALLFFTLEKQLALSSPQKIKETHRPAGFLCVERSASYGHRTCRISTDSVNNTGRKVERMVTMRNGRTLASAACR